MSNFVLLRKHFDDVLDGQLVVDWERYFSYWQLEERSYCCNWRYSNTGCCWWTLGSWSGIGLGTAAGVTASKHMDSYNEISNKIGELSMKADRVNQQFFRLLTRKKHWHIYIRQIKRYCS